MKKFISALCLIFFLTSFVIFSKEKFFVDVKNLGIYAYVGKNSKKAYLYELKINPKSKDKIDFYKIHKTEPSFTMTMVDKTHFKTKKHCNETEGLFYFQIDGYGEFTNDKMYIHLDCRGTSIVESDRLVVNYVKIDRTYFKVNNEDIEKLEVSDFNFISLLPSSIDSATFIKSTIK